MEYITFSVRIPKDLCDPLDGEAENGSRNRNQQINHILKERYHAHAPPASTRKQPPQFHSKANGRRVKTKAETA